MYKEVKYFDELKDLVLEDKQSIGLGVDMRNRYPIRFVLFDNFRDCSLFVDFVPTWDYNIFCRKVLTHMSFGVTM